MSWLLTASIVYGVGCAVFIPLHFAIDDSFPRNNFLASVDDADGAGFFIFLFWPFVVVYWLFRILFWIPTATVKGISAWWENKHKPKAIPTLQYPEDK